MEQIRVYLYCESYGYYSYMVAQEARNNGLDRNADLKQLSSALDIAYDSGRGMLPAQRSLGDHRTQIVGEALVVHLFYHGTTNLLTAGSPTNGTANPTVPYTSFGV